MSDDLEPRVRDMLGERARVSPETVERVAASIERLPDRGVRPRAAVPLAAIAAVLIVAVVGITLATLVRRPADVVAPATPSVSATDSPTSTPVTTPSPTPTDQPRPVWAMNVADHLDCDGPPSTIGMDVPAVPDPFDPAPTPDDALANILRDYSTLPDAGFTRPLVVGHWALHRYLVDGRAKVHVVSTDRFPDVPSETGWQVVGLRACDPSEFDPVDVLDGLTIWRDAADRPLPTYAIHSHAGPGHCDWERAIFLSLGREHTQYIRDPRHDLRDRTVMSFDPDVSIPADASDTGFHTEEWHLFTVPSGRAVYIRTSDGTYERWPRAREPIGCA
jgi:hypothetical protein